MLKEDLIGRKFGALIVVSNLTATTSSTQCDCGKVKTVRTYDLLRGYVKSCGCRIGSKSGSSKTHGMSGSYTYVSWLAMITRTTNCNNSSFESYGRKGVTVCQRWLVFENFYEDMGERPQGKSLERVKNSDGYSIENCRWATSKEQAENRSSTSWVTYKGRELSITEACRELGGNYHSKRRMMYKMSKIKGISIQESFNRFIKERGYPNC